MVDGDIVEKPQVSEAPSDEDVLKRVLTAIESLRARDPVSHQELSRALGEKESKSWRRTQRALGLDLDEEPEDEDGTWRLNKWYTPLLFWRRGVGPVAFERPSRPRGRRPAFDLDRDGERTAWDIFALIALILFLFLFLLSLTAIVLTTRDFVNSQKSQPANVQYRNIPDGEFFLPVVTICPTIGGIPSWMFNYTFLPGLHAVIDPQKDVEFHWFPSADQCSAIDKDSILARFNPAEQPNALENTTFSASIYNPTSPCRYCMRFGEKTRIFANRSQLFPEVYPKIRISMNTTYRDALHLDWHAIFVQANETIDDTFFSLNFSYWKSYGYRFVQQTIRVTRQSSDSFPPIFATNIVGIQLSPDQPLFQGGEPEDFVLVFGYESDREFYTVETGGYTVWQYVNDIMGYISIFCGLTLFHLVVYPIYLYFKWHRYSAVTTNKGGGSPLVSGAV